MPNDPKSFLSTDGLQALIANIKASLGATDYDDLSDKPKLNNVTVQGTKTSTDFGLQDKIDNSHKLNADLIDDSESINKFVTAAEKAAWNKSVSYMSIPNNGDLNDYYGAENAGNYLCTDANVSTLSHKPSAITTAFRMDVIFYNDQTIQVIYPNDEKCVSFLRIYKNNTWSDWKESAIEMTILSYGNSTWDDFMKAYLLNSIVYCCASSASNPQTSPQTRLAFMAYVNDEANPTEVEFQYYRSVSNKSDSAQGDEVYVYKLNKTDGWSNLKRNTYSKVAVAAPITKNYASGTVTISHADSGVTAGTYDSVTVNAKGHVTAGSNYTIDSTPTVNSQNLVTSGGVYTDQQRQQTETNAIANLGAKNFVKTTTFSFTTSTQIEVAPITGTVVLSAQNITSDDTSASQCAIVFNYSDGTSSEMMLINRGDNISVEKTFDKTVTGMTIYASRRESSSLDKTATFTNLMIRPATITDSTFMPYAPTNRELYETKTEQAETNIIANLGAKNYCPKETETSTSSGSTELVEVNIPAGTYILSFTGTLAYAGRLSLYSAYSSSSATYAASVNLAAQTGTQSIEFKMSRAAKYMQFYHNGSGNSLTNIMIRPASIVDPTFVPYSRTNAELTAENDSQQSEINYTVNTGVKNLLKFREDLRSSSAGNVYAKMNSDGTVSVGLTSGTTATAQLVFTLGSITKYRDRKLILSGCPTGGNYQSGYALYISNSGTTAQADTGNGATLPIATDVTSSVVALMVRSGTTISSELTFQPMVRDASIVDSTFQPYALPNPTLTPAVIKAVDEGAKNRLTVNTKVETGQWTNIPVVLQAGSYVLAIGTLSSTDTDATTCQIGLFNSENQNLLGRYPQLNRGKNIFYNFEINSESAYLRIYSSDSTAHGTGDTVTINDAMICTAADWAISQKFVSYALSNPVLTPALIEQVDNGVKNLFNLNTDFTAHTHKGITYTNNYDGTINVYGTSNAIDSYITLYDSNDDNLFGIQKGETVVLQSTSDKVSVNLAYKKSGGGYGLTVYGYKNSPARFTVPSDFAGFLLRIGVPSYGTTVSEDVGGMICTAADYAVSPEVVPYALSNPIITPALIKQVDEGSKNIADFTSTTKTTYTTATSRGVTITRNGDIFTVSGTSDTNDNIFFNIYYEGVTTTKIIPPGNWVAFIENYTGDVVKDIAIQIASPNTKPKVYGVPIQFSLSGSESGNWLRVNIRPSTTYNGSFRLMICSVEDWNVSKKFVPYAPTNRELYEMIGNINTILQGVL